MELRRNKLRREIYFELSLRGVPIHRDDEAMYSSDLVKDKVNIENRYLAVTVQVAVTQCLGTLMAINNCLEVLLLL